MDKNVKNVLAAFGAIAVVKAAPVLALGAAVGAVATNPEKVKKAAENLACRAEELACNVEAKLVEYGVLEYVDDECECCEGGPCTCGDECECEAEEVTEELFPDEEAAAWDEEVTGAEEEASAQEPEAKPASSKKTKAAAKMHKLIDILLEDDEE